MAKIVIAPRGSGKTTKILSSFDPVNDLLITLNKRYIKKIVGNSDRIVGNLDDLDKIRGIFINTLYIDEYLFFS